MVILSHPTGNANVRAVASGLLESRLLAEFRTSIASFPGSLIDQLGAISPLSEIRRRRFEPSLMHLTTTWPWIEVGRLLALKARLTNLTKHETGLFSIDAVYRKFDKHVASNLIQSIDKGARAIYAFEDGALDSFNKAKLSNITRIYDLPIGYWRAARRLLETELILKPTWAPTLTGFRDSESKLARKDEELQLADHIFVASQFTASTLKEFPGSLAPIEVIPYGFPPVTKRREYSWIYPSKPLKLLFVGGLSQRKGIADLFDAVDDLRDHVELTVVGRRTTAHCPALDAALAKHRWIPSLPHADILKLMQTQDVLVFPSLFEGFGLVITEAMSQGTPVITTERTAGPDLITHGENGWLIKAGSSETLRHSIENLLINPQLVNKNGKNAMEAARLRPWSTYGEELSNSILKLLNT